MSQLNIKINTVKIASGYMSLTTVGGVQVRGRRCDSELYAVQSLLNTLSSTTDDNSVVGLDLELSGQTLGELNASNE
jgi:hypothetical protein